MISRSRLPKPAQDWGLDNGLLGLLNTLINFLQQIIEPLTALVDAFLALFGEDTTE